MSQRDWTVFIVETPFKRVASNWTPKTSFFLSSGKINSVTGEISVLVKGLVDFTGVLSSLSLRHYETQFSHLNVDTTVDMGKF